MQMLEASIAVSPWNLPVSNAVLFPGVVLPIAIAGGPALAAAGITRTSFTALAEAAT